MDTSADPGLYVHRLQNVLFCMDRSFIDMRVHDWVMTFMGSFSKISNVLYRWMI